LKDEKEPRGADWKLFANLSTRDAEQGRSIQQKSRVLVRRVFGASKRRHLRVTPIMGQRGNKIKRPTGKSGPQRAPLVASRAPSRKANLPRCSAFERGAGAAAQLLAPVAKRLLPPQRDVSRNDANRKSAAINPLANIPWASARRRGQRERRLKKDKKIVDNWASCVQNCFQPPESTGAQRKSSIPSWKTKFFIFGARRHRFVHREAAKLFAFGSTGLRSKPLNHDEKDESHENAKHFVFPRRQFLWGEKPFWRASENH